MTTEREKARQVRKSKPTKKKAESKNAKSKSEVPPSVTASVTSIDEARTKRVELDQGVAELVVQAEKDAKPVELDMDEIDVLRIENLDTKVTDAKRLIGEPLQRAAQVALDAAIAQVQAAHGAQLLEASKLACAADEGVQKAVIASTEAVNAVIAKYTPMLPEGHAIATIRSKTGKITSCFNPESRGRLMSVPT